MNVRQLALIFSTAVVFAGPTTIASGFQTVLNVPPDSLSSLPIENGFRVVDSNTQVNLDSLTSPLPGFIVRDSSELNLSFDHAGSFVSAGGIAAGFGGTVNVTGNPFFDDLRISEGGAANIMSGFIPSVFIQGGGQLTISGGEISLFEIPQGDVIVTGGKIGHVSVGASVGGGPSELTIFGGEISENGSGIISIGTGSAINLHGGNMNFDSNPTLGVAPNGEFNFFGSEFAIDGTPISGLLGGEAFSIAQREVLLSGRLEDGGLFAMPLTLDDTQPIYLSSGSIITVTVVVPEPTSGIVLLTAILVPLLSTTRQRHDSR